MLKDSRHMAKPFLNGGIVRIERTVELQVDGFSGVVEA
jgi:hypothetical protein